jgi:hypothetical protein
MLLSLRTSVWLLLAIAALPVAASAQGFAPGFADPWSTGDCCGQGTRPPTRPFGDHWEPRRPPPMSHGFAGPGWLGGRMGWPGLAHGCCHPVVEPCCDGFSAGEGWSGMPQPLTPHSPGTLPVPSPTTPAAPGPDYVPRNAVPTPIETPDDPDWQPIPGSNAPTTRRPPLSSPLDLPTEIIVPEPKGPDEARRPAPRTSSRFVPVPTAARVWSLR